MKKLNGECRLTFRPEGWPIPHEGDFLCSMIKDGTQIGTIYHVFEVRRMKSKTEKVMVRVLRAPDMKPLSEVQNGLPVVCGKSALPLYWDSRTKSKD